MVYGILIAAIILVALLLILVVLAQNPKGGGLSSQFGGSGSSQIMGVKKTSDLLEKLTWGFAIALLVFTLATNAFVDKNSGGFDLTSPNIENAQGGSAIPSIDTDATDGSLMEELSTESSDSVSE